MVGLPLQNKPFHTCFLYNLDVNSVRKFMVLVLVAKRISVYNKLNGRPKGRSPNARHNFVEIGNFLPRDRTKLFREGGLCAAVSRACVYQM